MKVKTTQVKETELEIPVPSFYKDKSCSKSINDLVAILDENTFCRVFESDTATFVKNSDTTYDKDDLIRAFLNWEPISESEFLAVYERALTSMSLTPGLIYREEVNNPNGYGALADG